VRRTGLFVVGCATLAIAIAACAPKSNTGDDASTSATPTPSGSNTSTPTPPPVTDVTPVQTWVTPGGREIWVQLQAIGDLQIANLATYAANCTSELLTLAQTASDGQSHIFRFQKD